MNIFRLHDNPIMSAMMMNDQHVIKMILESAQLLSTAHWVLDGHCKAYRKTHENHPSAVWVRQSRANYEWLFKHFVALIDEHQYRYPDSKLHKSAALIDVLKKAPRNLSGSQETPILLAMPDYLKASYSGVQAYRMYYSLFKRFRKNGKPYTWTRRPIPDWY